MPPRRELNERFQGYVRRAERARSASTAFLAGLTVLAVVGSATFAFQDIAPKQFASVTSPARSASAAIASQLAAASSLPWLDGVGAAVYRLLCPVFRDCAEVAQNPPQNAPPQQPTKSANVKLPTNQQPAPQGAPATGVAGSQPSSASNPPTVINQPVIERIREVDAGWNASYVDEQVSLLRDTLLQRIAATENANATSFRSVSSNVSAGNITGRITNAIASVVGTIADLTATTLTATNATFTNATTTSLYVSGTASLPTTSVDGDLSISGTLTAGTLSVAGVSSGGAVAAPYFTATSSTASRFPYASSTLLSTLDALYVGRTATTTIRGDGVASTIPYASTTALTVSGTAYFPGSGIWNSSGNVGIGTASPDIFGLGSARVLGIQSGGTTVSLQALTSGSKGFFAEATASLARFVGYQVPLYIDTQGSFDMIFRPNTSEAMRLTAGGNVGVGNSSPTYKLDIATAAASDRGANIAVTSTSGTNYGVVSQVTGSGAANNTGLYGYATGATNNYGLRIPVMTAGANNWAIYADAAAKSYIAGDLGLGNTSPTYKLDVTGLGRFTGLVDAANFVATSTSATTTLAGGLAIETSGLVYDYSTNRVGIGTATPYEKLYVEGNIAIPFGVGNGLFVSDGSSFTRRLIRVGYDTSIFGAASISVSNYPDLLYLTSAGNVGVGSTTPWAKLSVTNTGTGPSFIVEDSTSPDSSPFIIDASGNVGIGTAGPDSKFQVAGTAGGLRVDYSGAGINYYDAAIHAFRDFDGTERMRITGGNVLIGTTTSYSDGTIGAAPLQTNALPGSHAGLAIINPNGSTASLAMIGFMNGNGTVGSISTSGSATAYNTSSDRRIKENIQDTSLGLDALMRLSVRDFSFKSDATHATTTGFIAQELQSVFAWAVTTNGDNGIDPLTGSSMPWSIDYGRITPLLAKAIQDLNLKLEDLATSTPEVEEGSFPFRFFAALKDRLLAWFADATNGIAKIVTELLAAKRVETLEICTTRSDGLEVCASGDQLAAILAGTSAGAATAASGEAAGAPASEPAFGEEEAAGEAVATTTEAVGDVPSRTAPAPEPPVAAEAAELPASAPALAPANDNSPTEQQATTGSD